MQVIAFESAKWPTGEVGSPKTSPILPQSKKGRGLDRVVNMLMEAVNRILIGGDEEENEDNIEEEEDDGDDIP